MLARARERGCYDELVPDELVRYLGAHPGAFDAIVSADTLNYFGNLAPVFAAAARALRRGGRFAFTLEVDRGDPAAGFALHRHGRYGHREDYVRGTLAAAGLAVACMAVEVLRREAGRPVDGWVIVTHPASEGCGEARLAPAA
jgi:predicted TPR repeat methyltransferase